MKISLEIKKRAKCESESRTEYKETGSQICTRYRRMFIILQAEYTANLEVLRKMTTEVYNQKEAVEAIMRKVILEDKTKIQKHKVNCKILLSELLTESKTRDVKEAKFAESCNIFLVRYGRSHDEKKSLIKNSFGQSFPVGYRCFI